MTAAFWFGLFAIIAAAVAVSLFAMWFNNRLDDAEDRERRDL